MKKINLSVFSIFAVLGWMLVIFALSSQTAVASNSNSKAAAGIILRVVEQPKPQM